MAAGHPIAETDARRFGRRVKAPFEPLPVRERSTGDDLRLFAMTFAAGFLFISIVIG